MKVKLSKPTIDKKDLTKVMKSFSSGWLTAGPNNLKFENEFCKKLKIKYALSLNSCTSALEASLKVLKKKGEVIIPSFTWVSTANAVLNTGNKPVFADIDVNSRNITANEIEKKISKRTVAVIVVHFSGLPCEMGPITKLCNKKKILLVEDSAETLLGSYKKKFTGSFGIGCFSFFPTKNITTAEGGMITTYNKNYYKFFKSLIAHGIEKKINKKDFWKREATLAGHNYRLPNHLALLGSLQLKKINIFLKHRRMIAKKYDFFFKKYQSIFSVQKVNKDYTHSYQMYTILIKNHKMRNDLIFFLKKNNIETSVHFEPPLHHQKYLKNYCISPLINTEYVSKRIFSLPMHSSLKLTEVDYVIKKIYLWIKLNEKKI